MAESETELYSLLVNGFREVSIILDEKKSTLAADPILAKLAARVASEQESNEVRRAFLYALDSRELSGDAEVVQYFAYLFQWIWLRSEVEKRYLDCVTNTNRRLIRHFERMLEAFSHDWEDRDLFPSLHR